MPVISIITINYNNLKGLKRTMNSVLNQTSKDFEYIVIDGGSTDGSAEYIKSHSSKMAFWVSEPDKGIYNAMNKGIQKANGEYLLFLNSGDFLVDDKNILQRCLENLQEDIVAFDCFLERDFKITGRRTHIAKPTLFYTYCNGLKHQSTFIKKELFGKYGLYNESYKITADYEFWIRTLLHPETTVKGVALPIAVYELGGISGSTGYSDEFRRIEQELLPHLIDDFRFFQQLLPFHHSRLLKKVIQFQKRIAKFRTYIKK